MSEAGLKKDEIYIAGIGASAGGLEAINELLDHISESDQIAFIVVQHLSSDYKSLLVELLGKHTSMPVEEARNGRKIEAGVVYVIPNNKELTIDQGLIVLDEKEFGKGPNTAIDIFFQSLATDQREYAIAVLLSGTGTDGTRGVETIKSQGGFVIVQDPLTAKFDGMPKSAIDSGFADIIVQPSDIYQEIRNYVEGLLPNAVQNFTSSSEWIHQILTSVFQKTGYDFVQYKMPTILRRIARRMQLIRVDELTDYNRFIASNENEAGLLAKEFFIGVTSFYRDKDAFAALSQDAIDRLVASKEPFSTLKVWVTACCTGQEAYTMAFLIDQAQQRHKKPLEIKIFASDIDRSSIEVAGKGKYAPHQLLGVDKDIIDTYFTKIDDDLQVIARIRKQIVFTTHDMLKDPPFIKNDLVSCRNFLIYLNPSLQDNVLSTLHFALNPDGYLFLGSSENPPLLRRGFSEINARFKIFQRNGDKNTIGERPGRPVQKSLPSLPMVPPPPPKPDVHLATDFQRVLTENLGYAGLYLNENYEVREGVGNFRKYLSLPDKLSVLNVLKMAPPELATALSAALRNCRKTRKREILRNLRIHFGEQARQMDLFLYPPEETAGRQYYLLVFADALAVAETHDSPGTDLSLLRQDQYVQQLEDELRETRTNLQMAVEGLETANEELQSSNEELQSANEELQSSNEELQSLNEELHTLNTEHQMRIRELVELNDDISNYLQSSMIGQIFLDQQGRIRRFNQPASAVVNVMDGDIGRPIDHITQHIRASTFLEDIRSVAEGGESLEREVELDSGAVYLIRILPYLRQDKVRDGLVITMVDISASRNLNNLIKGVFDASMNPIFVFRAERDGNGEITDYRCEVANYEAYHSFGREIKQESLSLREDFPELAGAPLLKKYQEAVISGRPVLSEFFFVKNEKKFWFMAGINKLQDGFVLVLSDVTQRREAEEKLRRNYNELLVTKETLKELNNRLEAIVTERTRDLAGSEERFRMIASLTNDVIWDWDFASNKTWWSESYFDLFGYDRNDEQVARHSFRLQLIHPDDRPKVQEAFQAALHGDTKEYNIAYRFRKKDGDYAHVLDRGTVLLEEQGIPYRMLGAMVDVTRIENINSELQVKNSALQNALGQFRFVTDFMPQMVWSAGPDGYHDFYNEQWFRYTGLDFEQTKDRGWSEVLHPDDYQRTWHIWRNSLDTGSDYQAEYRMRRHDGVYRWFLARALPMRDEPGKILKWFGTCTDIDDQKAAEKILEEKINERTAELHQINKRLEISNSDLMQFASVASHDLKEPLRKIHFFSQLIRDRFPETGSEHLYGYLDRIIKASSRATTLINDVLSYSRLSGDSEMTRINLNALIQDILQDFELVVTEKQARFQIGELPEITAVPGQMRQLFQNIINNGLKFHKPGQSPVIHINGRTLPASAYPALLREKGSVAEIRIRDEGIGFESQYTQKIFSLFQRLNSKDHYEGTGIGLAIANKIVGRHDGLIHAEGNPGRGAEFVLVIPELTPGQPLQAPEVRHFNGTV